LGAMLSVPLTRPRLVTLRDVAQRAGVSPTTASFVLAGREDMRTAGSSGRRRASGCRRPG
jgi:LacI family transcriptional regulator